MAQAGARPTAKGSPPFATPPSSSATPARRPPARPDPPATPPSCSGLDPPEKALFHMTRRIGRAGDRGRRNSTPGIWPVRPDVSRPPQGPPSGKIPVLPTFAGARATEEGLGPGTAPSFLRAAGQDAGPPEKPPTARNPAPPRSPWLRQPSIGARDPEPAGRWHASRRDMRVHHVAGAHPREKPKRVPSYPFFETWLGW